MFCEESLLLSKQSMVLERKRSQSERTIPLLVLKERIQISILCDPAVFASQCWHFYLTYLEKSRQPVDGASGEFSNCLSRSCPKSFEGKRK